MTIPTILQAQQVLLLLKSKGIKNIVLSPGSRNAPLTIGFTSDDFFTCYSIVDERCASHFALGIAQQIMEPVVLCCTSGSALLNYYPAIAEAFYSQIPLIVCSADRPPYKIDIGDGQTIRQQGVYSNHILFDTQLEMLTEPDTIEARKNNDAINIAIDWAVAKKGPVHINIPFEEPLYEVQEEYGIEVRSLSRKREKEFTIPKEFFNQWNSSSRKLVLIGSLAPDTLNLKLLEQMAQDPSVLFLSEVNSNSVHKDVISRIDTLIAPIEKREEILAHFYPELLITIGGMVVSKKIKQLLRRNKPTHHYHVGMTQAYDTYFSLTEVIRVEVNQWMAAVVNKSEPVDSVYQEFWKDTFKDRLSKSVIYKTGLNWSDFKAFDIIFEMLPDDIHLQLGNSSTIRYAQLFDMKSNQRLFCNRGTSGIDGSLSTAIGAAVVQSQDTYFITGDLSFFYDSNGLWNNYLPDNFKIIIINNQGGGIFRILPGTKNTEQYDTYFETTHDLNASHLSAMYGIDYQSVDNELDLRSAMNTLIEDHQPKILEIFTPRLENDTVLLDYFKFLT